MGRYERKEEESKDIFDRIMRLPVLRFLEPFYRRNKEILLYLFFGVLSFLISVGTYALFTEGFHVDVLISNIIAWILSVSFAYITNRIWVFVTVMSDPKGIFLEIGKFISGRLITLVIEEVLLFIFITGMGMNRMIIKISATIIVIILNYLISKLWVFTKASGGHKDEINYRI